MKSHWITYMQTSILVPLSSVLHLSSSPGTSREHSGSLVQHIFFQGVLLYTLLWEESFPRTERQDWRDRSFRICFHLASYMAPNARAWVGSVSVAFGRAACLTQLTAKCWPLAEKFWDKHSRRSSASLLKRSSTVWQRRSSSSPVTTFFNVPHPHVYSVTLWIQINKFFQKFKT